jgi:hypothetical protein
VILFKEETVVKYLLYVLRWVVLAVPGALFFNKAREILGIENVYAVMVISQAVMGAMVYFLDRLIFTSGAIPIPWEIKPRGVCPDAAGEKCCEVTSKTQEPDFICENCAVKKIQHMND